MVNLMMTSGFSTAHKGSPSQRIRPPTVGSVDKKKPRDTFERFVMAMHSVFGPI